MLELLADIALRLLAVVFIVALVFGADEYLSRRRILPKGVFFVLAAGLFMGSLLFQFLQWLA